MMTFTKAKQFLIYADSVRLANQTWLEKVDSDTYAVKYHRDRILLIHSDGTYTLNSHGYRSMTTKERLCLYSPCIVIAEGREWYIARSYAEHKAGQFDRFYDEVRVDSCGHCVD